MLVLVPIVLYLFVMLGIAWKVNKLKNSGNGNFMEEYFIGNREMGGFVLAMTIIATYVGASSFISGPGVAYKLGLGWVLLACIQTPTAFLTLGILGKRLAIISRKIGGVTITDLLRARYKNDIVVILGSIIMLIFLIGVVVANFVGGARLFESVTGLNYSIGLIIFSVVVILYTTIGGFRAVVLTDAIQGGVMLVATIILFFTLLKVGGGMENIMLKVGEINPDLLKPDSGGEIAKPYMLSFWLLVGVAVLGLPTTSIRCMGFKDSKSMHNAMIIGTSVVGVLMLLMHLIGVMGIAINPSETVGDKIIPLLALSNLTPILAGVFIGGPLAAIMSTVDSCLILSSATIIKDLYINYINPKIEEVRIKKISFYISLFIGILVFVLAINPPDLLFKINIFALAGQEATFFWPVIMGLYWKRANAMGAIASMIFGIATFIYFSVFNIKFFELHQIVPVLLMSLVIFIVGTYLGEKPDDETIDLFFNL